MNWNCYENLHVDHDIQGSFPFSETICQDFSRTQIFPSLPNAQQLKQLKPLQNRNPKIMLQTIVFRENFVTRVIDFQDLH